MLFLYFVLLKFNGDSFFVGTGSGLVTDWEQQSGNLMVSGDVRIIRVWDAHREMKVQV